MDKTEILTEATTLVNGPRAERYGDFADQMTAIAQAFNALRGKELTDRDVAFILLLLKMKRLDTGWDTDSAVDLAGYAALIGEAFCND